jgi:hypothetical protein
MYYQGDTLYSDILKAECSAASLEPGRRSFLPEWPTVSALKFSRKRSLEKDVVWYHTDARFSFDKFSNEVRFPFPDHRPAKVFKRESTDDYITSGLIARGNRQAEELKYAAGKRRPKKPKDFSYNGVHDVASMIGGLATYELGNLCPDPMHCLSNISSNLIQVWKKERALSDGSRLLAVSQGTHVILKYKKLHPRWTISSAQQDNVDAVVNSLLIPPNYKGDFSFKNPFKHRGHLKARDHMIWLMVYSSYALSFSNMGVEYITFSAMLAADICDIFNPCIDVDEMTSIIKRIYETRAVHEGLYPESEQIFIYHQLIDIVNHILKFGHLRGLSCYSSERANGFISQSLTKGGVRYLSTMYNRYVIKENSMLGHFLVPDNNDNYDNSGIYSDFSLRLFGKSYEVKIGRGGINKLFAAVFTFLATQELDNLFELSPFYRVYTAFEFLRDNKKFSADNFYDWLSDLNSLYLGCAIGGANKTREHSLTKYCVRFHFNNRNQASTDFTDSILGHLFEKDLLLLWRAIVFPTGNLKVLL